MIPARDRITTLTVYPTKADMRAGTNGTSYTEGIVAETARIERTYFTQLPAFASCNASMFECELNINVDLTGKWVRVASQAYATAQATTRTTYNLFSGRIDSCKYDSRQATRKLVAYDEMLQLRGLDVSDWWATYWASAADSVNASTVVAAMCTNFGVAYDGSNFNVNFAIKKAGVKALTGFSFAQVLAYVGQIVGAVFFIKENGALALDMVKTVLNATAVAIDSNVDTNQSEFDDTNVTGYGSFFAYEGADVVYSYGTASPTYVIRDNALTKGQTTSELSTTYGVTLSALSPLQNSIRGGKIVLIVSAPDEDFSKRIRKVSVGANSYLVSGVVLSGSQLIEQTLTCTSEMAADSYSSSQIAQANNLTQMGIEMTFKVNADEVIEAVNLEALGGVTINAEALNINGVVSANNGFKVNLDGSMEATAGDIGGWKINTNNLSKTFTDSSFNQYIARLNTAINTYGDVGKTPALFVAEQGGVGQNSASICYDGSIYLDGWSPEEIIYNSSFNRGIELTTENEAKVHTYDNNPNWQTMGGAASEQGDLTPRQLYIERQENLADGFSYPTYHSTIIAQNPDNIMRSRAPVVQLRQETDSSSTMSRVDTAEVKSNEIVLSYQNIGSTGTDARQLESSITIKPEGVVPYFPDTTPANHQPYIALEGKLGTSDSLWTKYYSEICGIGFATMTRNMSDAVTSATVINPSVINLTSAGKSSRFDSAQLQIRDRYAITCNLLDSALIEQGNISESSGAEIASTNRLRSGFCGVKASTSYTLSMSSSAEFKIALEYNSSKGFVGYKFLSGTSCTFTTDANVAFVRITIGFSNDGTITPSNVSNVQLEKGSQASSFVPFTMDGVEVAERCRDWQQFGSVNAVNDTATIPISATDMMVVPIIHGFCFNGQHYIVKLLGNLCEGNVYQDASYNVSYAFSRVGQTLTITSLAKHGWTNVTLALFCK